MRDYSMLNDNLQDGSMQEMEMPSKRALSMKVQSFQTIISKPLPKVLETVVNSSEAKYILETVNVPPITLAPTNVFRSCGRKRPSQERITSATTENYEVDNAKIIRKKLTSPLRLLPQPSFERLIGAYFSALRSSKLDSSSNSTFSLSTSHEEYRPFEVGNC